MQQRRIKQPGGKKPTKHDAYVELICPNCLRNRYRNEEHKDLEVCLTCHYCEARLQVTWKRENKPAVRTWFERFYVSFNAKISLVD